METSDPIRSSPVTGGGQVAATTPTSPTTSNTSLSLTEDSGDGAGEVPAWPAGPPGRHQHQVQRLSPDRSHHLP